MAVQGPATLCTAIFVPTSDEIAEAAATNAASGISSASGDGHSVSAVDPLRQLDVADRLARVEADAAAASDGKRLGRILGNRVRFRNPGGVGPGCGQ